MSATAATRDSGFLREAVRNRLLLGVAITFLSLTTAITKAGTSWLYAFFGICALVFFVTLVPETKDRSLEKIQTELGSDADESLVHERQATPERARV